MPVQNTEPGVQRVRAEVIEKVLLLSMMVSQLLLLLSHNIRGGQSREATTHTSVPLMIVEAQSGHLGH